MSADDITRALEPFQNSPLLPFYVLAAFLIAGALFLPVWVLIFQTGLLVAPPLSCALAFAGASMSASTFYLVGRVARRPLERRLSKRKRVLDAVRGARLEHIIALRLLPVLPFTLVNMSAGAFGVPFRTFLAGTVIGMAPGIFAVTLVGDRAMAVFKDPTPGSIAMLVGAAVTLVGGATLLRRIATKRIKGGPGASPGAA